MFMCSLLICLLVSFFFIHLCAVCPVRYLFFLHLRKNTVKGDLCDKWTVKRMRKKKCRIFPVVFDNFSLLQKQTTIGPPSMIVIFFVTFLFFSLSLHIVYVEKMHEMNTYIMDSWWFIAESPFSRKFCISIENAEMPISLEKIHFGLFDALRKKKKILFIDGFWIN